MTNQDKVRYTAKTHTTGGREHGVARSSDGHLDVRLSSPGSSGAGTNPEQLFAAGWSACFEGALKLVAGKMKIALPTDSAIDAEVDLCVNDDGYHLQARLNISLPGLERDVAQKLVDAADQACPYSKAIRGNVPVTINLVQGEAATQDQSDGRANSAAATAKPAAKSGAFAIGGEFRVQRLGFGTMQLTGPGVWGEPADRTEAIAVLRKAVDLGINLIDTADSYGPYVAENLIREALHPYPAGLMIATKAGLTRTGPNEWVPLGRPEYLRQECEMSLRRLNVDRIDLFQLHRIDPNVPAEDQFGLLRDLQNEGKVRYVGLSEVNVAEIEAARRVLRIVTVQNLYNLMNRKAEEVLEYCTRENIGFIPWFPLATGNLARPGGVLERAAQRLSALPSQIAIAWLLRKSPVMLPIPGTSKVQHLEENTSATTLQLDDSLMEELDHLPSATEHAGARN